MNWSDVLEDKTLQDLPYKIELNEWGQIVMSPASNRHGMCQFEIGATLKDHMKSGKVITECSILTDRGVKVPDVVWCSEDFIKRHGFETPFPESPEICVEIISPSNTQKEMDEKMKLYFEKGTREVWLVTEKGDIRYYQPSGEIQSSSYDVTITL